MRYFFPFDSQEFRSALTASAPPCAISCAASAARDRAEAVFGLRRLCFGRCLREHFSPRSVRTVALCAPNFVRLFPEIANQNTPGLVIAWAASISEVAHASDGLWAYMPITGFGQATDSAMRGSLQALDPDPMLWPLTTYAAVAGHG